MCFQESVGVSRSFRIPCLAFFHANMHVIHTFQIFFKKKTTTTSQEPVHCNEKKIVPSLLSQLSKYLVQVVFL
jgi:phage-related protein